MEVWHERLMLDDELDNWNHEWNIGIDLLDIESRPVKEVRAGQGHGSSG